jgi:excisionase family DNA binding protein
MFLTFSEACEHLRVSPETLRGLIKRGEIEAHKSGTGGRTSAYRISIESVNAWIERNTIKPITKP